MGKVEGRDVFFVAAVVRAVAARSRANGSYEVAGRLPVGEEDQHEESYSLHRVWFPEG